MEEDRRKREAETKITNVLAEVLAGKFKFVRLELEESDIPALHRAIGGPRYIAFADMFRALRGLRSLFSYSHDQLYFQLVDKMLVNAHPMDLHDYHDRRAY